MCRAWRNVPVGLRRAVDQWVLRAPQFLTCVSTFYAPRYMTQVGAHVLVAVARLGVLVFDEGGRQVCAWPHGGPVHPSDMAAAPTGEVVVLDGSLSSISVYRPNGTLVRTFGYADTELRCGCLAVTPQGHVIVAGPRTLFEFRLGDGHLVHRRRFRLGSQLSRVRATPCGEFLWATNWYRDCIDLVRVCDGSLVRRWSNPARGVKWYALPDGVFAWQRCLTVANKLWVSFIRLDDGALVRRFRHGEFRPNATLVTHQRQLLWVSDCASSCIRVYSLRTKT